jgi:hypothetical protein
MTLICTCFEKEKKFKGLETVDYFTLPIFRYFSCSVLINFINYLVMPKIVKRHVSYSIPLNQSLKIEFDVSGYPDPQMEWYVFFINLNTYLICEVFSYKISKFKIFILKFKLQPFFIFKFFQ